MCLLEATRRDYPVQISGAAEEINFSGDSLIDYAHVGCVHCEGMSVVFVVRGVSLLVIRDTASGM